MKRIFNFSLLSIVAILFLSTCKDSIVTIPLSDQVAGDTKEKKDEELEKIFIVDRTGKEWDITHAINVYGFDPDRFMFGLGPDAIKPILKPQMLSPGDEGYPENTAGFTVMGTSFNGLPRAYKLTVMSSHEVVDEVFGTAHVAVAY